MPQSGSYHYPTAQAPNSSYPSVDLRGLSVAPVASAGLGKFFVSASLPYFIDDAGTVTSMGGGGSSDPLTVNTIVADSQHLILSSSAGSQVHVSGGLSIEPGERIDFDGASGDDYIYRTTSSGGSIYIIAGGSTGIQCSPSAVNIFRPGHMQGYDFNLSSGAKLISSDTDVVLSSSATSIIAVSGGIKLHAPEGGANNVVMTATAQTLYLKSLDGLSYRSLFSHHVNISGNMHLTDPGSRIVGQAGHVILSSSAGSVVSLSGALKIGSYLNTYQHLIYAGNSTSFSFRNAADSSYVGIVINSLVAYSTATMRGKINNDTGNLLLSASGGSELVEVDVGLKLNSRTEASLAAGSTDMSGALVWVSDKKTMAVYGPEGWTRVLTGTL